MATAVENERLPRKRDGGPRIQRTDDVLDYWVERINLVAPGRENFQYSSMICESDSLFHYGHHFELARIMRDKRGRTRLVLLNGDSWGNGGGFGPSTASRQRDVQNAVARTDAANMVVPFSALEGAGIDFTTIMPIHVRDARFTTEQHSSRERPAAIGRMPDPSGATVTEDCYHDVNGVWTKGTRDVPVYVGNPNRTLSFHWGHGYCETGAERDENGVWHWETRRHWLGDSLFRARTVENRTRKATAEELAEDERHRAWGDESERLGDQTRQLQHQRWKHERENTRDYRRTVKLAMAGRGIEKAVLAHNENRVYSNGVRNGRVPIRVNRWATFLSSFDYQEPSALYFLCELPYGAKPNTVEEAVETLKPPEVVAALARGLNVIRQGDVFAIPTKLNKRQIRRMRGRQDFTKRLRVLGTNHSVTEGIVCKGGAVLGRGIMRHEPDNWRPPDHIAQKLNDGKVWHLLVRNTVPRTR